MKGRMQRYTFPLESKNHTRKPLSGHPLTFYKKTEIIIILPWDRSGGADFDLKRHSVQGMKTWHMICRFPCRS